MQIPAEHKAECERFEKVIRARKSSSDLMSLFEKLEESTKFSEAVKPYGYGLLLDAVVKRVADRDIRSVLAEIARVRAAEHIRAVFSEEEVDALFAKLVAKVFNLVPCDYGLVYLCHDLENCGVSSSLGQTIGYCCLAQMSELRLDAICGVLNEHYFSQEAFFRALERKQNELQAARQAHQLAKAA